MKNLLFAVMALTLMCGFVGCRSYTIVNGKKYKMLTKAEEAKLLAYAKEVALQRGKQIGLTPAEMEFVRTREPEVRSEYVGDCTGSYIYQWAFSTEKTLRISFGGDLLLDKMEVRVETFHDTCGGEQGNKVRMVL